MGSNTTIMEHILPSFYLTHCLRVHNGMTEISIRCLEHSTVNHLSEELLPLKEVIPYKLLFYLKCIQKYHTHIQKLLSK